VTWIILAPLSAVIVYMFAAAHVDDVAKGKRR
jgi:hypothetical protein